MQLEQIGPYIFIGVMVLFIFVLIFGSKWNQRLLKEAWDRVAHNIAPHSETIGGKIGHNLFRMVATPKKESPFRKLNIIMSTMDRENAFHYILRYFHQEEDLLVFQGDIYGLLEIPALELVPSTAKVLRGRVNVRKPKIHGMLEFSTKDFGYKSEFLVFAKTREIVQYILKDKEVRNAIEQAEDILDRISISEESPHLLVTCIVQLKKINHAIALFYTLGMCVRQYERHQASRKR